MIGLAPVVFWPGMLIAFVLLIAASWFLVRHAGLAAVTVLSPLPGIVLAALGTHHAASFFGYIPGFMAAGLLAATIAQFAASVPAQSAIRSALSILWLAFLAVFLLLVPSAFNRVAAFTCMAGEVSAVIVTALATMLFSYDEDFVVRINRATEARVREIERLNFLVKPRWGMSIGGVGLVFSVLGFFGAQKDIVAISSSPVLFAAWAVIFAMEVFVVSRNIRRALADILAMVPVALLTIALSGRFAWPTAEILLPLTVGGGPVLFMTASALGFERGGDRWDIATQRGVERFGAAIAVTTMAAAAATLLFEWQSGVIECAALFMGGVAALILQPALTTMLYTLFPKRVTLEEAFRKR